MAQRLFPWFGGWVLVFLVWMEVMHYATLSFFPVAVTLVPLPPITPLDQAQIEAKQAERRSLVEQWRLQAIEEQQTALAASRADEAHEQLVAQQRLHALSPLPSHSARSGR